MHHHPVCHQQIAQSLLLIIQQSCCCKLQYSISAPAVIARANIDCGSQQRYCKKLLAQRAAAQWVWAYVQGAGCSMTQQIDWLALLSLLSLTSSCCSKQMPISAAKGWGSSSEQWLPRSGKSGRMEYAQQIHSLVPCLSIVTFACKLYMEGKSPRATQTCVQMKTCSLL